MGTANLKKGSINHCVVYSTLVATARQHGLTTYQQLALQTGLPVQGNYLGSAIGEILGNIVDEELTQGRPMLSAVVVGTEGTPGEGFYALAAKLGKFSGGTRKEELAFWESERDKCYKTWLPLIPKDVKWP